MSQFGAPVSLLALAAIAAGCGDNITPGDRSYDAQAYALRARFDPDAAVLIASEDVTVALRDAGLAIIELDAEVDVGDVHAGALSLDHAYDPVTRRLRVDLGPIATPGPATFTVDYRAPISDALLWRGARDDDPVTTRVVFTDSEPDRGARWLVAKHDPDDRALWSVELTVAPDHDAIGNGARIRDELTGAGRVIGYALDKPLPTYLMAFAAGELEHTDRTTGRVPLSVWHRRGLAIDPERTLDVVADAMASFERLLIPYPWDSYTVVLVPEYGGGMENATITFNAETSGLANPSFGLNAHELAHHWFGDWVTMTTYDDVWIKEGMATLLAAEAERARRDGEWRGRLFGGDFSFDPSEAVVDPSLTGLAKYTSGPYERAAWTITQIRALIGEAAFWGSLRQLLADHALGSVGGEDFVRGFAPALDEPTIQRILAAIRQHGTVSIAAASTAVAGGTELRLTLDDPSAVLIAPITLARIDAAGGSTAAVLAAGQPVTVTIPNGGYLALDETDVHPSWSASFDTPDYATAVAPLLAPSADAAVAAWATRSAAHQERTLADAALPSTAPAAFSALYPALDSSVARRSAVFAGCDALAELDEPAAGELRAALVPFVAAPAVQSFSTRYGRCGSALPADALGSELATLAADQTVATSGRLEYLIGFDYGASSFDLIAPIARSAPTIRVRDTAIARLAAQAQRGYSAIPIDQGAAWRALFRERLALTTSQTRLLTIWRAVVAQGDIDALAVVAPLLHTARLSSAAQVFVICSGYDLAAASPATWTAFQDATKPWDQLAPEAATVLRDPGQCALRRRSPSAEVSKAAAEARDTRARATTLAP